MDTEKTDKTDKKSETLEVRVSHSTKLALAERAQKEGLTMSELVRKLVKGDMSGPSPEPRRSKVKPVAALAGLAALVTAGILMNLPTPSKGLELTVSGEFSQRITDDDGLTGQRVKRFNTIIEMTDGSAMDLKIPGFDASDGETFLISISPTTQSTTLSKKEFVLLDVQVSKGVDGEETLLVDPSLRALLDETAQYMTTLSNGDTLTLDFKPRKI